MDQSLPPVPKFQAIANEVVKFSFGAKNAGSPLVIACVAMEEGKQSGFYCELDGDTTNVIGGLLTLIARLTPRDFALLRMELDTSDDLAYLRASLSSQPTGTVN